MSKSKFSFECQKCGECCLNRGPVPLVIDDLVLWAKNNVIANFMPYLKFIKTPYNTIDLVLSKTDENPFNLEEEKKEADEDLCCPLLNKETQECTIYEFRPLSCRTYPLEYDGKSFQVVDSEDPGLDKGELTKEQFEEMKNHAKDMNEKLTTMRITMPIIAQAMQPFVIKELIEAQKRMFDQLSPEEKKKLEEEMKGS